MTGNGFYQSKEWRHLLRVVKQERMNENGDIICECCGKPITNAYDCIGHHTIELDESNVNDASISLNPDLIQLVHHACHNRIHNKFRLERQVFLVYGSPLSGKSTWVRKNMNSGDLVIDIDSIWQCVSGLSRYEKPERLKQCVFSVRDKMLECVKYRIGKWNNAYIMGGYPFSGERERMIRTYGAREIFIDTSKEECLERLKKCQDGRNEKEWEEYIEQWWKRYAPR